MVAKELKSFEVAMQELMKSKLPLSRKTVERVTDLGYAALTYYKHVAVIIEKFIQKCRPAYKVCGLYVIDALVRYTIKHKGRKGDVLGPRFIKNFPQTFENVMNCPSKDYPKVIRVLNLWQAKKIYSCDVIQPLLDIVTSVVESREESRSPSVGVGPSTPPINEDYDDDYHHHLDPDGGFESEIDQFPQPQTPPLPTSESFGFEPSTSTLVSTPQSTGRSSHSFGKEAGYEDLVVPRTSENVRKLGEFLNVSAIESNSDAGTVVTKASSAEFLQLLKTVNDEFSQELPDKVSTSKTDQDLSELLKSDLEQEILGVDCVKNSSVDMSKFSPISDSRDLTCSEGDMKSRRNSSSKPEELSRYESRASELNESTTSIDEKLASLKKSQGITDQRKSPEKEEKNEIKKKTNKEKEPERSRQSRSYRKREPSPLLELLPSGSDLDISDEGVTPSKRKRSHSKEKKTHSKSSRVYRNHRSSDSSRDISSVKEKSRKKSHKSKKKKKKKDKKSKKSKSKKSSDDEGTVNEESKTKPTTSLKEELEAFGKKKKKKNDFDLDFALKNDPSVNYGSAKYPSKCFVIFSTVLSISNITDLSFKEMNELLKVYGPVLSVEMVVSLNKALVNYGDRRAACAALVSLRHKNQFGISWAFPKPVSQQPWIEMWDGAVGCCVIPWDKMPSDISIFSDGCQIDFSTLPPEGFTKPNEVTSSTDANRDTMVDKESAAEIKKKIATMIANSQKAVSPKNDKTSKKDKKDKKDNEDVSSPNSLAFKSAFAPVESSSSSTEVSKVLFGWGAGKKIQDTVTKSKTEASSTSEVNVLTSSGLTTPSATTNASSTGGSDIAAQYQKYLQDHAAAAAMYQQMTFTPQSYQYAYPYYTGASNAAYGAYPPELSYAYSGYGSAAAYYQPYPITTQSATAYSYGQNYTPTCASSSYQATLPPANTSANTYSKASRYPWTYNNPANFTNQKSSLLAASTGSSAEPPRVSPDKQHSNRFSSTPFPSSSVANQSTKNDTSWSAMFGKTSASSHVSSSCQPSVSQNPSAAAISAVKAFLTSKSTSNSSAPSFFDSILKPPLPPPPPSFLETEARPPLPPTTSASSSTANGVSSNKPTSAEFCSQANNVSSGSSEPTPTKFASNSVSSFDERKANQSSAPSFYHSEPILSTRSSVVDNNQETNHPAKGWLLPSRNTEFISDAPRLPEGGKPVNEVEALVARKLGFAGKGNSWDVRGSDALNQKYFDGTAKDVHMSDKTLITESRNPFMNCLKFQSNESPQQYRPRQYRPDNLPAEMKPQPRFGPRNPNSPLEVRPFRPTNPMLGRNPVLPEPRMLHKNEPVRIRIPILRPRNPVPTEATNDRFVNTSAKSEHRLRFPRSLPNPPEPQGNHPAMPRFVRTPAIRPDVLLRGSPGLLHRPPPPRIDSQIASRSPGLNQRTEFSTLDTQIRNMSPAVLQTPFARTPVQSPRPSFPRSINRSVREFRPHMTERNVSYLEEKAEQILRKEMQVALSAIKPSVLPISPTKPVGFQAAGRPGPPIIYERSESTDKMDSFASKPMSWFGNNTNQRNHSNNFLPPKTKKSDEPSDETNVDTSKSINDAKAPLDDGVHDTGTKINLNVSLDSVDSSNPEESSDANKKPALQSLKTSDNMFVENSVDRSSNSESLKEQKLIGIDLDIPKL